MASSSFDLVDTSQLEQIISTCTENVCEKLMRQKDRFALEPPSPSVSETSEKSSTSNKHPEIFVGIKLYNK